MAATGTLKVNDRVWHLSQRNSADRKIGTVQKIFTKNREEWAHVLYDGETQPASSPTANLTKRGT